MPFTGGSANKFGLRYELKWTAICIAELLLREAKQIEIEPLGKGNDKIEFRLDRFDGREFHQVKRQQARHAQWTLTDLKREGVIDDALRRLDDPVAEFYFVSTIGSPLSEVSERARIFASFPEFLEKGITSENIQNNFDGVRVIERDAERAFNKLRRLYFVTIDENSLDELLERKYFVLVGDQSNTAVPLIGGMVLERVHTTVRDVEVWTRLKEHGILSAPWANRETLSDKILNQTNTYIEQTPSSILGIEIPREHSSKIVAGLRSGTLAGRLTFIIGDAGSGKSVVAKRIAQELLECQVPVLGFRLDRTSLHANPREFSRINFDLPSTPAETLAIAARKQPAILIIDQLDTVSIVSGRNPNFFQLVERIVRDALRFGFMHVLLVCRAFDLRHDPRLRSLRDLDRIGQTVDVGRLTEAEAGMRERHLEGLLEATPVGRALLYASETHLSEVLPIIRRMLDSSSPELQQVGARLISLAALDNEDAIPFAEWCMAGPEPCRMGAAEVYSANVKQPMFRERCEGQLTLLFNDVSEKVHREAGTCWFHLRDAGITPSPSLTQAYINSRAFGREHEYLFDFLADRASWLPDNVLDAAWAFVKRAANEVRDLRTHTPITAQKVSEIVISLHQQTEDNGLQTKCLDLIDELTRIDAYGLSEALAPIER